MYDYILYIHIINVLLDLNIHTPEYSIYISRWSTVFLLMISLWFGTRFEASAKRKMGVGRFMILFQLATCTFHWSSKKRVVTWTRFSQGKVLNPIWGSWDRRDGLHDPQRINEFDVLTLGWLREMWKPKFFSVRWSFAKAWSHPHADLHLRDERQLDRYLKFLSIDVLHENFWFGTTYFFYTYIILCIYNYIYIQYHNTMVHSPVFFFEILGFSPQKSRNHDTVMFAMLPCTLDVD